MAPAAQSQLQPPSTRLRLPEAVDADVSVVIVSFNTKEMTLACVASVLKHKGDLSVEVIVIDNQSSDGSSDAIREAYPEVIVIDSPANGGFAYGNAIGFEQASGKHILLLNPDTQIYDGGLQACITFLAQNPEIGIMGPKVLLEDGTQQSSMMRFLGLRQFFFLIFVPSLWIRQTHWFGDPRYAQLSRNTVNRVDAVSGCFMFARREVLEQVGGLDTRFFMYGEEAEWCFRVRQSGWQIAYNPQVEILHHGAASTAHMSEWKAVEMTRGHILFLRLARSPMVAWLGTLLMAARDSLRAPYHLAVALSRGLKLSSAGKAWWARLKFELGALFSQPKGQTISLPDPTSYRK